MSKSKIEWTEETWNPTTGCRMVSPGCTRCYAIKEAHRMASNPIPRIATAYAGTTTRQKAGINWTGQVNCLEDRLEAPLYWRKPRRVFVNSMSDLFNELVPLDFIRRVFDVMGRARQHTFQVLTKRSGRLAELAPELVWHPNVWMGVSVENQHYTSRIEDLAKVPAAVRFLSIEPLLGPIENLPLKSIHWVIVGGESGPKSRRMEGGWARSIRDQCQEAKVPFFFKQWGAFNEQGQRVGKRNAGRLLDGQRWDGMPEAA